MSKEIIFDVTEAEGRGGGGKGGGGTQRTPVEAENSLSSNTIATVVDLVSEGEIEGLVGGTAGIYFNEIPLYDGGLNFDGVSVSAVNGLPYASQGYLGGITDETPSETSIGGNQEVTKDASAPAPQTIDADTDDIRLNLYVQTFQSINNENGDINPTKATVRIDIQPDGGSWQIAKYVTFDGKRNGGQYVRSIRVNTLSDYGTGPWLVRVVRITADSESTYLTNNTYWSSFTEIIARKLNYPNSALVGFTASAREFGSTIPKRAFHLKGIKCTIPTGYDPVSIYYDDPWDGSMESTKEYTNNQAWLMYELITNKRFGLGATLSTAAKAELYNISKYNDDLIDDGGGETERRYTFNYQYTKEATAMNFISDIATSCRTMVYYDGESLRFAQDRPTTASKLVTNSNVIDGLFNYSTTAIETRFNVANVTWFDMDDFCRPRVEAVENKDGIIRYNTIRKTDIVALGCTSRGQAYRHGNWELDTALNQTIAVSYQASWDHADVTPGDVIKLMDYDYAGVQAQEGRIVSATISGVVIDSSLTMVGGHTYTLDLVTASGTIVLSEPIDTDIGDQTELTFTTPIDISLVPQVESVFIITDVNELEPRQFKIISNKDVAKNVFEITAVQYDPNKFARVEDGFQFAPIPYTNLPAGAITAPTNLSAEEYAYTEGGLGNHKFGLLLTWNHSTDPRRLYYELQYEKTTSSGTYSTLDPQIVEDSWKHQPLVSGTYDYRVRAIAVTGRSAWETLTNFSVVGDPAPIEAISGLEVVNGSDTDTFIGKDCQIIWDAPTAASGTLRNYKLEVYTIGDSLLRTEIIPKDDTTYTYWYGYNEQDNDGTPLRTFKFKVYGINYYNKIGAAGVLVVDNPIPDMSSTTPTLAALPTGIKINWAPTADYDLSKYKIYCDTSSPPTTEIAEVGAETTYWLEMDLAPEITYYVQIEPYDEFGVGTKSQISNEQPTKMPWEDVETELIDRLNITDSLFTTASGLAVLVDYDLTTGGVAYTSSDWIQFEFPVEQLQNAVWFVSNASTNCYFSYKSSTDSSWTFLKAEADHTLDANSKLLIATNESDAQTNYWTTNEGDGNKNVALYPNGITGLYLRMHVLSSITLRELRFIDQVIAELIIANQLSVIAADCGTLTAGTIQSSNFGAADGFQHDLDNDTMKWGGSSSPAMEWDGSKVDLTLSSDGRITVGTGDDVAAMAADDATYRFWCGDGTAADAPFRVEKDGTVHMSEGEVTDNFTIGGKVLNSSLIKCLWWETALTFTPTTGWGSNYNETYGLGTTVSGFFPDFEASYICIDAGALAQTPAWTGSKGSKWGWGDLYYQETRWDTKLEVDGDDILLMVETFDTWQDNDPYASNAMIHLSDIAGACDNTTDACQDFTSYFYEGGAVGGNIPFGAGSLNRYGNGPNTQWGGVINVDGVNRDVDISYRYSWVRDGYNGSETVTIRIYGWATFLRVDEHHFPTSTGWAANSPATGTQITQAYVD